MTVTTTRIFEGGVIKGEPYQAPLSSIDIESVTRINCLTKPQLHKVLALSTFVGRIVKFSCPVIFLVGQCGGILPSRARQITDWARWARTPLTAVPLFLKGCNYSLNSYSASDEYGVMKNYLSLVCPLFMIYASTCMMLGLAQVSLPKMMRTISAVGLAHTIAYFSLLTIWGHSTGRKLKKVDGGEALAEKRLGECPKNADLTAKYVCDLAAMYLPTDLDFPLVDLWGFTSIFDLIASGYSLHAAFGDKKK